MAIKYEHASVGELWAEVFRLMPEPDDSTYEDVAVIQCASALLELRRRAVDKQNVAMMRDVATMRQELRDVVTTIKAHQAGHTTLSGIVVPGSRGFHSQ
jgi:hypothetical protein